MQIITKLTSSINSIHYQLKQGVNLMNAKRTFAALVIASVIATVAGAQYGRVNKPTAKKKDLTGTWLLTITPGEPGAPSFEGLYTFTSDGIAMFSSVGPPIPGLGNPGHGVWVRTGPNTFAVTFKQFTFDDTFTTNGSLVVSSNITLTGDDDFTSEDTSAAYDLSGNVVFPISGSEQGRRMKIE